jgi:hypothetical protein
MIGGGAHEREQAALLWRISRRRPAPGVQSRRLRRPRSPRSLFKRVAMGQLLSSLRIAVATMKAALRWECRPLGTDHAQIRFVIGSATRPRACYGALCSPSGGLSRHHCRISVDLDPVFEKRAVSIGNLCLALHLFFERGGRRFWSTQWWALISGFIWTLKLGKIAQVPRRGAST